MKKTLLALIPPHEIYIEVFCGSAKLLFAKEPSGGWPTRTSNHLDAPFMTATSSWVGWRGSGWLQAPHPWPPT